MSKKDALIPKRDKVPESGYEPYDESEEHQEIEDQRQKIIKKKKSQISSNLKTNKIIVINQSSKNKVESSSAIKKEDDKKEKKIKIDKKKLWELISDHKLDAVIGTIAGIIYGGISPAIGIFLGNVITALSYPEPEKVKSEGYKYGMIFIGVAFVGGISIFLKMWKLQCLGTIISVKIKKKIIKKYLEFHMGYFDVDKHSPGALLTQLSIDSSQLDTLILNLIGGTITVISTLLISLILGIMYDWKTTLILFVFVPFIIYGIIKHDDYKENGRESNKEMKIEAGSILSECVINMKTIMSFNFQNKAIEIYENILSTEKKHYFKDSLKLGFWMGLGLSAYNFAFGAIYKCGFLFLREKSVTFENLTCCITNISNSCDGLSDILRNMGDSKKAKLAFKSVFRTLYTKSFIPPFESENKKNSESISPSNSPDPSPTNHFNNNYKDRSAYKKIRKKEKRY